MADIRELMGSVTETLEKKLAELSDALEKKVTEVEDRSAQVEKSREELEEEKRMMSTLLPHGNANADTVELNVGGTIFHTKRAALLTAEGSLLAAMFSGRWEESLDRDKEGRVFFDFDPAHFRVLLNHLRLHRIAKPKEFRPPVQQPEHEELFGAMVDFLGLREFLHGPSCDSAALCDTAALECTPTGSPSSISVDGHTISGGGTAANCVAVGKKPLLGTAQATSAAWKVSFTKLQQQKGVCAGIIANSTPGSDSFCDATSYLWNSSGSVWTAGRRSESGPTFQEGDSAIFFLDAAGNRLRMFLERTGQIHDMPLQEGVASQARLHLRLYQCGREVVLSAATVDEVSRAGL